MKMPKAPKPQPSISSIRRASTPTGAPAGVSGLFTRKNAVYAALAGALGGIIAATPACGEPFTSGPDTHTDAGVDGGGGSTPDGGTGGTGGTVLEGGAGQGGEAGAGGEAACEGVEITLSDMAEYEYKIWQNNCGGSVIATSLDNGNFETGSVSFCLPAETVYTAVFQVRDHADLNSLEIALPQGEISLAEVTTLDANAPIDGSTADMLCNASAGWTAIDPLDDDKNSAAGHVKYNGNTEGDAGVSNSNSFLLDFNL